MELILKLPEGKPPYIGILFSDEVDAGETNSDFVLKHKDKKFKIIIEVIERKMYLRLICQEIVAVRHYNDIKFNSKTLADWLFMLRHSQAPLVYFVHLVMRNGKYKMAKTHPNFQNFRLQIQNLELVGSKASLPI